MTTILVSFFSIFAFWVTFITYNLIKGKTPRWSINFSAGGVILKTYLTVTVPFREYHEETLKFCFFFLFSTTYDEQFFVHFHRAKIIFFQ